MTDADTLPPEAAAKVAAALNANGAGPRHETTETEWGEPIPLGDPDPPAFPVGQLGDLVAFLASVANATQTPLGLVGPIALAVISAALQGRVRVEARPGWVETVNLYVCCIAAPGEGKSPVFIILTGPLAKIEKELRAEDARRYAEAKTRFDVAEAAHDHAKAAVRKDPENSAAGDALAVAKEKLDATPPAAPFRLFIGGDTTPEALGALAGDVGGVLAVLTDEGSQLFENTTRYQSKGGAANVGVLLAGYDAGPYEPQRIGRTTRPVDRLVLTVGMTAQPVALTTMDPAMRGRGLPGRFLFSFPTPIVGSRDYVNAPPVDVGEQARWATTLDRLARTDALTLTLSLAAVTEFDRWRAAHEPRLAPGADLAEIADWANKHPGRWLRLAGLLHELAGEGGTEITVRTALAATDLCDYFTAHALKTFGEIGSDPALVGARAILAWLTRRSANPEEVDPLAFAKRDAQRALPRMFQHAADLDDPLGLLKDRGWIRPDDEDPRTPGKPGRNRSPRYRVNPAAGMSTLSEQ